MNAMGSTTGPCCIFAAGMMNFIDPAKRKRRATTIWAPQSKRLMVLALELDMVGSPLASAALAPEGFERLAAFTTTSDERPRNRHGGENSAETGLNDGWMAVSGLTAAHRW